MKLSIVDVSPVAPHESKHDALNNAIRLAQHAENGSGFELSVFNCSDVLNSQSISDVDCILGF